MFLLSIKYCWITQKILTTRILGNIIQICFEIFWHSVFSNTFSILLFCTHSLFNVCRRNDVRVARQVCLDYDSLRLLRSVWILYGSLHFKLRVASFHDNMRTLYRCFSSQSLIKNIFCDFHGLLLLCIVDEDVIFNLGLEQWGNWIFEGTWCF